MADLTLAPIEIGFQSLLAVSSLATQPLADVETLAGKAPLSLFFLTVAPSGERKSSCDKLAMEPVQTWEEDQFAAYLHSRKSYEFELEVFESLHRKQVRVCSGSDGDVIETNAPQAPIAPIVPRKVLSDVTYEGLLHHFEDGDPSVGIFSDEGGQIFGGHAMSKDNQLKTSAGLSKVWDGAPLNRTRAGDTLTTFRHRRGCLHLMVQTGVAESVFSNETFRDQGLLSRCLISQPQSRIGQRLISEGADELQKRTAAKQTLADFHTRITGLLSQPHCTNGNPRELSPPTLELSPDARSRLVTFANEVERQQGKDGDLAHIAGFASKTAEQAARIAGVFSVLADPTTRVVTATVMWDAIRLMAWYLTEAQRALDVGHVDPSLHMAERLRVWLLDKMPREAFDKRTIVRFGPTSIRDTKTVEKLLGILERHHWIVRIPSTPVSGKKAATTWRVLSDV
ncbi:YfjI family protein [uncultured Roseobacter sp.]|uniref:YfjI family protein n=1 Tax=uncultured Roseobacter sp. TaxID=114847 RepID=UPI0026120ACA|nr:YfjI family protein [uncultured Roseobacter sp.]